MELNMIPPHHVRWRDAGDFFMPAFINQRARIYRWLRLVGLSGVSMTIRPFSSAGRRQDLRKLARDLRPSSAISWAVE